MPGLFLCLRDASLVPVVGRDTPPRDSTDNRQKVLFLTPFSFFLVSHFGWRLLFCKNNFKFSFFIILIFTLPFFISLFYHIHIFYYYLLCHISFIKLSLSPHQHFYYYLLCHISFIKLSLSPH